MPVGGNTGKFDVRVNGKLIWSRRKGDEVIDKDNERKLVDKIIGFLGDDILDDGKDD